MDEEVIKYRDWETGEEIERRLSNSHPAEHKTDLICPFDNSPIIRWYDEIDKGYKCPNCNIDYSGINNIQEEVDERARDYFSRVKNRLKSIEEERRNLEKRLNHAIDKDIIDGEDLFSKFRGSSVFPNPNAYEKRELFNKPNLSSQNTENIKPTDDPSYNIDPRFMDDDSIFDD
ncbi:MAG: hypothetical protein ACOC1P_03360 [Minisyncoccales bacterium]